MERQRKIFWTPEEEQTLRDNYGLLRPDDTRWGKILPRHSAAAINSHAAARGMSLRHVLDLDWTEKEDSILREAYARPDLSMGLLRGLIPGHDADSIRRRAWHLALSKPALDDKPGRGRGIPWTAEEDDILREHWDGLPCDDTGWEKLLPGRTGQAIRARGGKLGLQEPRQGRWTREEDNRLRRLAQNPNIGLKNMPEYFPRHTYGSIQGHARKLGIRWAKMRIWTDSENETVRKYYGSIPLSDPRWAKLLPGRSRGSIISHAKVLGIEYVKASPRWTAEEERILRENAGLTRDDPRWKKLLPGRTPASITSRAYRLTGHMLSAPSKTRSRHDPKRRWTPEEDRILKENIKISWQDPRWKQLLPDRDLHAIKQRALRLTGHVPGPHHRRIPKKNSDNR